MNTRFPSIALCLPLIFACNKSSTINSEGLLLSRTKWNLTDIKSSPSIPKTVNGTTVYFSDVLDYYQGSPNSCFFSQDLTFGIEEDPNYIHGAYTFRQGAASCAIRPDTTVSGSWFLDFNTGEQQLYLRSREDSSVYNAIYKVTEITRDTLILSQKAQFSGSSAIYNFSYIFTPAKAI